MLKVVKQLFLYSALLALSMGNAFADETMKPFVLGYKTSGDIQAVADEVKAKVQAAGFEIAGSYSPYDGAIVMAITNDALKQDAASSEFGGYAAGQRVTVTQVGDEIQVSYTNPLYLANAYRLENTSGAAAALQSLQSALGNDQPYGTGDKQLTAKDLRKYHYMFGMEYFDDPSELAEYDSYEDALAAVEEGLAEEGVEYIFGYPGGAVLHIYDALYQQDKVHHILVRHEQAATHAADGYARSTGKPGVVLVTSGPGATNTLTGMLTAHMDSVPIVVISGQSISPMLGKDAFQEADVFGLTMPVVKHSYLVKDANDIPRIMKEAFYIATSGRPGPVVIDIPKDITRPDEKFEYSYPESVKIRSYFRYKRIPHRWIQRDAGTMAAARTMTTNIPAPAHASLA